jgi:hypothetical protein
LIASSLPLEPPGTSSTSRRKSNSMGRVSSLTTFIMIVIILFALVSIIVSMTQQENIISVVIRHQHSNQSGSNNSSSNTLHDDSDSNPNSGITTTTTPTTTKKSDNTGNERSNHRYHNNNNNNNNKKHHPNQPSSTPKQNSPFTTDDALFLPWNVTATTTTTTQDKELPNVHSIPMIYQYYTMHSVMAVRHDPSPNRTYSVAFLPCLDTHPNNNNKEEEDYYTSEILHNFFNTFVWSIITNRTMIVQWYNPITTTKKPHHESHHQQQPPSPLYHIHLKNMTEVLYTCSATSSRNPHTASSSAVSSLLLSLTSWMVQWSDLQQYHPNIIRNETIVPIPLDLYRQRYDSVHTVILFPQILDHFQIHPSKNTKDSIFYNHWYQHPLSYTSGIQVRTSMILFRVLFCCKSSSQLY